jgi:small Trp-rich protein
MAGYSPTMLFLVIGLVLCGLKLAEIDPVAAWSWWAVLSPFAAAAIWWTIADATGLTKKRAIDRMEQRKTDRRQRDMQALGLNTRRGTPPARGGVRTGTRNDPVSAAVDRANAEDRDAPR